MRYIIVLGFFKFGVGALLLLGAWDSMAISGNVALNICIATALAFVPAAFAKPLVSKYINTAPQTIIGACGLICAFLILIVSQISNFKPLLMTIYFILWILIFVIEASTEGWFFTLAVNKTQEEVRSLSAVSMVAVQVSVVLGPIGVVGLKPFGNLAPYFLIFFLFVAVGVLSLTAKKIPLESKSSLVDPPSTFNKILFTLAFSFIWPAIAVFNMVIPIVAKTTYNSLNVAAIFEFMLGGSTVLAGLLMPVIVRGFGHRVLLIASGILSLISASVFCFFNHNVYFGVVSIAALGFSFGVMRIEGRAALSKAFPSAEASKIIATANALSAPLVVTTLFFAFKEYEHISEMSNSNSITLPIVFVVSTALFLYSFSKTGFFVRSHA